MVFTVVPRILFDGWSAQNIQELEVPSSRDKVINLIINTVKVRLNMICDE